MWGFTISILLLSLESLRACPDECRCEDKAGVTTGDSEGWGLYSLPPGIPKEVGTLILKNNSLDHLPSDSFVNFTQLQTLHLQRNWLVTLPVGLFSSQFQLTVLYLYGNRITSLPDHIFTPVPKLERLHLSGNQLAHFSDAVFAPLVKLKTLLLSGNRLQALSPNSFQNLQKLSPVPVLEQAHFPPQGPLSAPAFAPCLHLEQQSTCPAPRVNIQGSA